MSKPIKYSKQLDGAVVKAAEEILKRRVLSCTKITTGSVNHVYKVGFEDNSAIVLRVFGEEFWPPDGKLPWVENALSEHGIAHAKILYYSRDKQYFPYGFMIMEFVEGKTCSEVIGDKISFEELYGKLGKLLKKIHQIRLPTYGDIGGDQRTFTDFAGYVLEEIRDCLNEIEPLKLLNADARRQIDDMVRSTCNPHTNKFEPVLVHWDAGPENCILKPNGELVLVDWDNARSHIWIQDYAVLTYWEKENKERVRESFLESHGLGNFKLAEVDEIEKALHALFAAKLLPYFYHHKEDMEAVEDTRNRLLALLG